jgi:hypothetical protein
VRRSRFSKMTFGGPPLRGDCSMVILSLPFVSNSFPGHPDKNEFSAEAGQATWIQIDHVQNRTLICCFEQFAISPVLYSGIEPMRGKSPNIPAAANFALTDKNSFCLTQIRLARICRGRRTPVTGLRLQANGRGADASFFAASSILALHPLSTCSSFRAKSSKMSATGHYACPHGEKGAALLYVR